MLGIVVPAFNIPDDVIERFVMYLEKTNGKHPHFLLIQRECPIENCLSSVRNVGIAKLYNCCDKVVCIDVDMLLQPGILEWAESVINRGSMVLLRCRDIDKFDGVLRWNNWSKLPVRGPGVGGFVGGTMEDWIISGGWNENLVGWGHEDWDFWNRTMKCGIQRVDDDMMTIVHVKHNRRGVWDASRDGTSYKRWSAMEFPFLDNFLWKRIVDIHGLPSRIPKIIHQIWIGDKLMPVEWMSSWWKMNPGWEYRVWTWKDILDFGLVNENLFKAARDVKTRVEIAKYEILWRFGGVFVEADVECISPLDTKLLNLPFWTGYDNGMFSGFVIGAEKGSCVMRECVSRIRNTRRNKLEYGLFCDVLRLFYVPEFYSGNCAVRFDSYGRHYRGTKNGLYKSNPYS